MSSAPTPTPEQGQSANQFTLHHGSTQITYNPVAPGPIISGKQPGGPRLQYQGEEGSFTFSDNQVQSLDCPLGQLISVTLQPNADAGALIFTLVLPSVRMGQGSDKQSFKAIGIKTKTRGFTADPGADETYSVLELKGVAAKVMQPLTASNQP